MNVVVLDAGERLGALLVAGALSRGHRVTAFGVAARAAGRPPGDARNELRTAPGDLVDRVAVAAALAGQDAVLYAVEPPAAAVARHAPRKACSTWCAP